MFLASLCVKRTPTVRQCLAFPHHHPSTRLSQICKKSTQFQGYEQQDAHELLRCLLEAIRNEEILRAKRAILKAFALSEKTDPNTVSPRLKTMIKGYGRQATHTIVDQIFGGQLISTSKFPVDSVVCFLCLLFFCMMRDSWWAKQSKKREDCNLLLLEWKTNEHKILSNSMCNYWHIIIISLLLHCRTRLLPSALHLFLLLLMYSLMLQLRL